MAKSTRKKAKKGLSKSQLESLKKTDPAELIGLCARCSYTFQVLRRVLLSAPDESEIDKGRILNGLRKYILEPYPVTGELLDFDKIADDTSRGLVIRDNELSLPIMERKVQSTLGGLQAVLDAANSTLRLVKLDWRLRAETYLSNFPTTLFGEHNLGDYEATVYRLAHNSKGCSQEIDRISRFWRKMVKQGTDPIYYFHCANELVMRMMMRGPGPLSDWRDSRMKGIGKTGGSMSVFHMLSDKIQLARPLDQSSVLRVADLGKIGGYIDTWAKTVENWEANYFLKHLLWVRSWALAVIRSHIAMDLCAVPLQRWINKTLRRVGRPWEERPVRRTEFPTGGPYVAGELAFASAFIDLSADSRLAVKESLDYLLTVQHTSGYWEETEGPGELTTDICEITAMAIHGLATCRPHGWETATRSARDFLLNQQLPCGCWPASVGYSIPVLTTVFILDAIELANGGTQVTFKLPIATALDASEHKVFIAEAPSDKPLPERFTFAPGQAMFDGRDLGMGTGAALDVLRELVENFGKVVAFKQLDENSSKYEASEKLRTAIGRIRKKLKTQTIPAKIDNRMREGYIILLT